MDACYVLYDTTWGSITGKPSTFPPSSHNHDSLYTKIISDNGVYYIGNAEKEYLPNMLVGQQDYYNVEIGLDMNLRAPKYGKFIVFGDYYSNVKLVSNGSIIIEGQSSELVQVEIIITRIS